jgi:hypothetical protein
VAMTHYNIAKVYNSIQQYSMANQHVEQAVEIVQEKLPENHHCIIEYRNLLEEIQDKIVTHF